MPASEVTIFKPNSRGVEKKFRSMLQSQLVERVSNELGFDAGVKTKSGFASMKRLDMDLAQFRMGDRRVRLYTDA